MGILTDDMKRVVREQRLGFIATVCADGTPNLSPKGTTMVLDDDHLVFADIASPGTVRNLREHPSIEINFVDQRLRKGYRFKGTAQLLTAGAEFERAMRVLEAQVTRARERVRTAVVVRIERALPLTSPAYDLPQTEEEISEHWTEYWLALWRGGDPPTSARV